MHRAHSSLPVGLTGNANESKMRCGSVRFLAFKCEPVCARSFPRFKAAVERLLAFSGYRFPPLARVRLTELGVRTLQGNTLRSCQKIIEVATLCKGEQEGRAAHVIENSPFRVELHTRSFCLLQPFTFVTASRN